MAEKKDLIHDSAPGKTDRISSPKSAFLIDLESPAGLRECKGNKKKGGNRKPAQSPPQETPPPNDGENEPPPDESQNGGGGAGDGNNGDDGGDGGGGDGGDGDDDWGTPATSKKKNKKKKEEEEQKAADEAAAAATNNNDLSWADDVGGDDAWATLGSAGKKKVWTSPTLRYGKKATLLTPRRVNQSQLVQISRMSAWTTANPRSSISILILPPPKHQEPSISADGVMTGQPAGNRVLKTLTLGQLAVKRQAGLTLTLGNPRRRNPRTTGAGVCHPARKTRRRVLLTT